MLKKFLRLLILQLCLLIAPSVDAQSVKDVERLEKMVLKQYKSNSSQNADDVHLFHVYDVYCDNRDKRETFADTSFIKKLEFGFVRVNCRRYLLAVSMVCNSDNKIVGEWHWNAYSNRAAFFNQSFMIH